MGLDIYVHRTHCSIKEYGTDWTSVCNDSNKEAQRKFRIAYRRGVKKLSSVSKDAYKDEATKLLKSLGNYSNYPEYELRPLGYKVDWIINENGKGEYKTFIEPVPIETFIEKENEITEAIGNKYDAYFRKVNFLYGYFADSLVDEVAWVTREDVEDIIDRCERVKKDHSLADELLPTQGGFFFGSTQYDDWYFTDIEDVLKQFKHLLKMMDKGWNYYIVMSW